MESDIECLSKAIHVVVFDNKTEFNVGRRVNNDITVSDISVSRNQACLKLRNNKLVIEDCDSKFGTFVKIQGLYKIPKKQAIPVQIEKKCFFIQQMNRESIWKRMCSCFSSQHSYYNNGKQESIDFFKNCYEKFPEQLRYMILSKSFLQEQINEKKRQQLVNGKQKSKQASMSKSNKILDESVISQIVTELNNSKQAHNIHSLQ